MDEGGETDRRNELAVTIVAATLLTAVMFELELMRDRGSLAGRDPMGGIWAGMLVDGALMAPLPLPPTPVGGPPTPPTEVDVEARITAAAALGVVRLLSGTKGV